jgi:tetratricopeptide (TPR) repeat protein
VRRALIPVALVATAALVAAANIRDARQTADPVARPSAQGPGTSRAGLTRTVEEMSARLRAHSDDRVAVVNLSDALIRLQRVNNDGRAVIAAEQHLREFLAVNGPNYEVERTLTAVLLSQHRFGDAIALANKLQARDPRDAWNYGAMGDGYLELGDYDRAFASFDRMGQLQPGPSAYARVAYALELKGDLEGALTTMRQAADGTTPNDAESQAWHFSQVGSLLLQQGRPGDAKREFERAAATFPNHPLAMAGLAKIKIIDGDLSAARLICQSQLAAAPTPDMAAIVGDLSRALGESSVAEQYYKMAEQIERAGWGNGIAQPQALARFFAERGRNSTEAVQLAETAATTRRDIFTMDTLAWTYFKAGRMDDARRASDESLRTGTRDPRILYHAAEIRSASGDTNAALTTLERIPALDSVGDVLVSQGAKALRERLTNDRRTAS